MEMKIRLDSDLVELSADASRQGVASAAPAAVTALDPSSPMATCMTTAAVHAGRQDLRHLGVHAPPLDLSSTYPLPDPVAGTASLDAMAAGGRPVDNAVYGRLHNPTVARFENGLANLEGTAESVAFASGMAALTACLLAAKQRGDGQHVVAVRPLYGGSDHLLGSGLLGVETTWAQADDVASAVRPDTVLVIIETPANPTLQLVDIEAVVRQAGEVPVLVDSTFATPVLQRPNGLGAALVLHSATKFLGGHGDVLAGVVACDEEWAAVLRQVRVITGSVLHPLAGYLLHRGLATLPLRVERASRSATELARRLVDHPCVERVYHPSLATGRQGELMRRQMEHGGAVLAFEVRDGEAAALATLGHVRLMTSAVSLGSVDSLIQHPASLTHRIVDTTGQAEGGIRGNLLRLSVGLEAPQDLWRDLDAALRLAAAQSPPG